MNRHVIAATAAIGLGVLLGGCTSSENQTVRFEQRNMTSYLRGPYNFDFFARHSDPYRFSTAIHFAHGRAHDMPHLTPLDRADHFDRSFDAECVHQVHHTPRTGPHMELWGPHTGQFAWKLYRTIDWTHYHHDQTYDILSSRQIPWSDKKRWTDRSVDYYLKMDSLARSPAPLDVTMRRAGVMMKPYFGYFRNRYPQSSKFFFVAHWWHPAIYEAMMIAGNDEEQDASVQRTHELTYTHALKDRPLRMLLSREMMPRYSRMSPESANIFDNLHMLHGIAYDILSYEGWTEAEKRAELYRVIEAMSEQPGDRALARKFPLPHPDMDPRRYEPWMKTYEGEMNRIMKEMHQEMMPLMMPEGEQMTPQMRQRMMDQMRMKLTPGMQDGEYEGSLHDAMMKVMPDMKMTDMMREGLKPGKTPRMMIDAMLAGWRSKHGDMAAVAPFDMSADPSPPPIESEARKVVQR